MPTVVDAYPLIEEVLDAWRDALAGDYAAYRGHVYRMFNFCRTLHDVPGDADTTAIAAAFHDLGIWSDHTFDYLEPSVQRMEAYLDAHGRQEPRQVLGDLIRWHHKLTPCGPELGAHVEAFRRADLVDLSLGGIRFGIPRTFVREVRQAFPNAGFHRCLVRVSTSWLLSHPLRPLPMMRW